MGRGTKKKIVLESTLDEEHSPNKMEQYSKDTVTVWHTKLPKFDMAVGPSGIRKHGELPLSYYTTCVVPFSNINR